MSETHSDDEPTPFVEFLAQHNRGQSERELADTLRTLIQAVQDTGKKGSLTYTLDVKPDGKILLFSDKISVKLPEHARNASVFYPDEIGRLYRNDPNQLTIDDLVKGTK